MQPQDITTENLIVNEHPAPAASPGLTATSRMAAIVESVPTPTADSFHKRQLRRATRPGGVQVTPIPIPGPIPPILLSFGSRVLEWKQDPFVAEIGIRKSFIPSNIGGPVGGLRDARIVPSGPLKVIPNSFNDYIATPGTDEFDWIHTFAVVRQTLTMYQRQLGTPVPWEWNSGTNTDPITVFPHAGVTMNAFYSRQLKALKFFFFNKPGAPTPTPVVFTCRSLDIVSHETGHAVLDGLKPHWLESTAPQTGALHEAFGDLTAIFVALSQMDQVEALIAQSKANLHNKNFLADLAEEFGNALGRPNGLRNADNDLRLSQVSTEVHDLSQVFTGALYDILADFFVLERNDARTDPADTLYRTGQYLCSLLLRAIAAAPAVNATFADVANQMLIVNKNDGRPVAFRNAIRNRFTQREVVVSPTPFTAGAGDVDGATALAPALPDHPSLAEGAVGERRGCCGTMRLHEHADSHDHDHGNDDRSDFADELKALKAAAVARGSGAAAGAPARAKDHPKRD